jgi:hypothetical protein
VQDQKANKLETTTINPIDSPVPLPLNNAVGASRAMCSGILRETRSAKSGKEIATAGCLVLHPDLASAYRKDCRGGASIERPGLRLHKFTTRGGVEGHVSKPRKVPCAVRTRRPKRKAAGRLKGSGAAGTQARPAS